MLSLQNLPVPADQESFVPLFQNDCLTIEAITSSNRPETTLYDQDHDEAVLLFEGEATLEINGKRVTMKPGDILYIPAHTPHRVLETRSGTRWLAIHTTKPLQEVKSC